MRVAAVFRRFHRFTNHEVDAAFKIQYGQGVQPAPEIRVAASQTLHNLYVLLGEGVKFDCVHMRRRDFVADHAAEELSVQDYARRAAQKLLDWRKLHNKDAGQTAVYLASDVAELSETRAAFLRHFHAGMTMHNPTRCFTMPNDAPSADTIMLPSQSIAYLSFSREKNSIPLRPRPICPAPTQRSKHLRLPGRCDLVMSIRWCAALLSSLLGTSGRASRTMCAIFDKNGESKRRARTQIFMDVK